MCTANTISSNFKRPKSFCSGQSNNIEIERYHCYQGTNQKRVCHFLLVTWSHLAIWESRYRRNDPAFSETYWQFFSGSTPVRRLVCMQ